MALRERYIKDANGNSAAAPAEDGNQSFQEMKARLHRAIVTRLDLSKLSALSPERVHGEVSRLAEGLLQAENLPLSAVERERLVKENLATNRRSIMTGFFPYVLKFRAID